MTRCCLCDSPNILTSRTGNLESIVFRESNKQRIITDDGTQVVMSGTKSLLSKHHQIRMNRRWVRRLQVEPSGLMSLIYCPCVENTDQWKWLNIAKALICSKFQQHFHIGQTLSVDKESCILLRVHPSIPFDVGEDVIVRKVVILHIATMHPWSHFYIYLGI